MEKIYRSVRKASGFKSALSQAILIASGVAWPGTQSWSAPTESAVAPLASAASPNASAIVLENWARRGPHAFLELRAEGYRSAVSEAGAPGQFYPSLGARGKFELDDLRYTAWVEAAAAVRLRSFSLAYVHVPEAVVGTKQVLSYFSLDLGRKLLQWSELDEVWKTGQWQPRFRWNPVTPESAGLIGLFIQRRFTNHEVGAFASIVSLPEQGPSLDFQEGRFVSTHPFALPPPTSLPFLGGRDLPIEYQLQMPALSELLIHPSFGAILKWNGDQSLPGLWAKGAYVYQPMHQVFLGYEAGLRVDSPARLELKLHPYRNQHHLFGLEGGLRRETIHLWGALQGDMPMSLALPENWTHSTETPAYSAGLGLEWAPWGRSSQQATFAFDFIHTRGGVGEDVGVLASPGQSLFESRFPFRDAASLRSWIPILQSEVRTLGVLSRFLYEFHVGGIQASTELRATLRSSFYATLGFDVIASQRAQAEVHRGADSFWNQQTQDRIRGGIGYGF